jgi:hypothetical protein
MSQHLMAIYAIQYYACVYGTYNIHVFDNKLLELTIGSQLIV